MMFYVCCVIQFQWKLKCYWNSYLMWDCTKSAFFFHSSSSLHLKLMHEGYQILWCSRTLGNLCSGSLLWCDLPAWPQASSRLTLRTWSSSSTLICLLSCGPHAWWVVFHPNHLFRHSRSKHMCKPLKKTTQLDILLWECIPNGFMYRF